MEPESEPELTIVLLGKTGVGKSAAGNTILGKTVFESKLAFKSVTTKISEVTGKVFGKQIRVIDTPGILDTKEDISKLCQELLQSSKPCLFLIVVKVDRFTKEDETAVNRAIDLTAQHEQKKSFLLFTGGDVLNKMSISLDQFISDENAGYLLNVIERMNGTHHLFNNDSQDQDQVRSLLEKSGHLMPSISSSQPRRIVFLGMPGAGKSSTGNTILGSKVFKEGCDFDPVTKMCASKSRMVEGRNITVVDTPGFTDEVLTPEQLYEEIMKTVVEANPGPHAFCIVVRLGRITEADFVLFKVLKLIFDKNASKYSMVIFTHGDELKGKNIDELVKSNDCVSDLVSMCGNRYCVIDNNQRNKGQVRNLLKKIDEMVSDNAEQHYTSDMFRMVEELIKKEKNQAESNTVDGGPTKSSIWEQIRHVIMAVFKSIMEEFIQFLVKCKNKTIKSEINACFSKVSSDKSQVAFRVTLAMSTLSLGPDTEPLIKKNTILF